VASFSFSSSSFLLSSSFLFSISLFFSKSGGRYWFFPLILQNIFSQFSMPLTATFFIDEPGQESGTCTYKFLCALLIYCSSVALF
jgi:hypothetical protein